jgi:hypothetical protein
MIIYRHHCPAETISLSLAHQQHNINYLHIHTLTRMSIHNKSLKLLQTLIQATAKPALTLYPKRRNHIGLALYPKCYNHSSLVWPFNQKSLVSQYPQKGDAGQLPAHKSCANGTLHVKGWFAQTGMACAHKMSARGVKILVLATLAWSRPDPILSHFGVVMRD